MESVDILERLVSFPTVSRDSNLGLIGFVRDTLSDLLDTFNAARRRMKLVELAPIAAE